jgi:hypothetical protein
MRSSHGSRQDMYHTCMFMGIKLLLQAAHLPERKHGGVAEFPRRMLRGGLSLIPCSQCCGSGMFIPDPRSWFLPIPDTGSKTSNKICCHTFFKGLVARCHSFYLFFTLIEQTSDIEHHSCCPHCFPLGRGSPLGCRAEIRTRACRTASRRATI